MTENLFIQRTLAFYGRKLLIKSSSASLDYCLLFIDLIKIVEFSCPIIRVQIDSFYSNNCEFMDYYAMRIDSLL